MFVHCLIKKNLDHNVLKNYRPVSNLTFLGKTLERVVISQLNLFLQKHNICETHQSAYRAFHSTESAILKVQNDILQGMDNKKISLLVLLDLSAAFDTVDHQTFLSRLKHHVGIDGIALKWFESYLSGRRQSVCINDSISDEVQLEYGLPQGSVIGPSSFSIYTLPLGEILRKHDLQYHCYADDTQIYESVEPVQAKVDAAITKIERCIDEIRAWMSDNYLKLNDDKTEFIVLGSNYQINKVNIPHIRVGNANIVPSAAVRNLGIMMDSGLTMESHINAISKAAYMSIRNIGRIRTHLNKETTEMIVHAFITSKIDIGNALLSGIPKAQIKRLQRIQNIAARITTYTNTKVHITPVLKELHWLPVEYRVQYKVALYVYKALNGIAPAYIAAMVNLYMPSRKSLRSSSKKLIHQKAAKTQWGDRSFSVAAAKLWNTLPGSVKYANSIDSFKKNLKTFLFKTAY